MPLLLFFITYLVPTLASRIAFDEALNEAIGLQELGELKATSLQDYDSSTAFEQPGLQVAASTGAWTAAGTKSRSGRKSRHTNIFAHQIGHKASPANFQRRSSDRGDNFFSGATYKQGKKLALSTGGWAAAGTKQRSRQTQMFAFMDSESPGADNASQSKWPTPSDPGIFQYLGSAKVVEDAFFCSSSPQVAEEVEDGVPSWSCLPRRASFFSDVTYKKFRMLGEGASGKVYKATVFNAPESKKLELPQRLAIKVISEEDLQGTRLQETIFGVVAQERLHHPNIVNLYDVYAEGSNVNLVMELVEGPRKPNGDAFYMSGHGAGNQLLDEMTAHHGSALGYERSLEVFKQLVAAVLYCHKEGVALRALHPANTLLVDEHKVKIGDFGLSLDTSLTGTWAMEAIDMNVALCYMNCSETPCYMPPEIVMNGSLFEATGSTPDTTEYDAREYDLWSLGMMLYEMLTGSLPAYTKSIILNEPGRFDADVATGVAGMSAPIQELILGLLSYHHQNYPIPPDSTSSMVIKNFYRNSQQNHPRPRARALKRAVIEHGLIDPLHLCEGWEEVLD